VLDLDAFCQASFRPTQSINRIRYSQLRQRPPTILNSLFASKLSYVPSAHPHLTGIWAATEKPTRMPLHPTPLWGQEQLR